MDNKSFLQTTFSIKPLLMLVVVMGTILGTSSSHRQTYANGETGRSTTIVVGYTEYEWWLSRWQDNENLCHIYTDHEGFPTASEVYIYCGESVYEEWAETTACSEAVEGDTENCSGVYLHLIGSTPREKEVTVELPIPEASVSLEGCHTSQTENLCSKVPVLRIVAQDPLPNEHITQIQGRLNEIPFMCQGQTCDVPLRVTSTQGVTLEFWADSSYGDSTKHYRGRVRVVDSGLSDTSESNGWYVDLMSEGGDGKQIDTCAQAWEAFPPIGTPPPWLANPTQVELLASNRPLSYLAGQLIANGIVEVRDCKHYGLLSNGYASPCGLEEARREVFRWQNLFDPQIIKASQESGIPSQILKRLFAQESQFWPGVLWKTQEDGYDEYGLGQLTELGADTVLLWNQDFFYQFCPLVLNDEVCQQGYTNMEEENQILLRGALLANLNAECPECSQGIDMESVNTSISYFAQTLAGNCKQVGEIVSSGTGKVPGESSSYEDLWRFTLVNYHAGSGCLKEAVEQVVATQKPVDWEHVSLKLETVCPLAIEYVEEITK
ncbi:MAG: hypothetical protein MAG431_02288 [Chloroflexi bacterium]|nr:hypothetical protein [Chloroflexota bacterium]